MTSASILRHVRKIAHVRHRLVSRCVDSGSTAGGGVGKPTFLDGVLGVDDLVIVLLFLLLLFLLLLVVLGLLGGGLLLRTRLADAL